MSDILEKHRKQLLFRASHRGTKEMDLLMGSFAEQHVPDMSADDLDEFGRVLSFGDPELYNWYLGKESVPNEKKSPLLSAFLKHTLAVSA